MGVRKEKSVKDRQVIDALERVIKGRNMMRGIQTGLRIGIHLAQLCSRDTHMKYSRAFLNTYVRKGKRCGVLTWAEKY